MRLHCWPLIGWLDAHFTMQQLPNAAMLYNICQKFAYFRWIWSVGAWLRRVKMARPEKNNVVAASLRERPMEGVSTSDRVGTDFYLNVLYCRSCCWTYAEVCHFGLLQSIKAICMKLRLKICMCFVCVRMFVGYVFYESEQDINIPSKCLNVWHKPNKPLF